MSAFPDRPVVVMMPVFNDWLAAGQLLQLIDRVLADSGERGRVLLIDDGSVEPMPADLCQRPLRALERVEVLSLRRNLGHQRAIAIGVAYVEQNIECEALIIMDGDGEDAPRDIPRLLGKLRECGGRQIVFAARMKRSEGLVFRVCYHLYRHIHRALTGIAVRVGNYSAVPAGLLPRLVVISEMWNHYAAAVFRSRIPYTTIPTERAPRLAGRSRMNFVSLAVHALSAMSVFGEIIGVRLLLLTGMIMALALLTLGGIVVAHVGADLAFPGWAAMLTAVLALLLLQGLLLAVVFVFMTLSSRSSADFLPVRDYVYFVDSCKAVYALSRDPANAVESEERGHA